MTPKHVNCVVVGAGAGGGIVAKELAAAGLSVVLLERGRWQSFEDHDHDELISQRTTSLGNAFGPDDVRSRRVVRQDGRWRVVLPSEGSYQNNAACVGGGTFSYGAMAWRFMEQDFKMRSIYGAPEGSSLEDWPLAYSDLEPFYEKAEWEIGVSGDASQNPFSPPRQKPYPMPPFAYNREGEVLKQAGDRLGLHPFPIPMLRNSVSYGGRPACIHCRYCVGFACEVNAKCGTHNTVIPTALATGNCELRTECTAKEVMTDDRGRALGVSYFGPDGWLQTQRADLIVVSGSATESPRLLLNSKSRLFPTGLGNRFDWVGRNLQGHAYPGAFGLFEHELYDDVGPGACIAACDYNHGNPGLRGGGMLANEFIRLPYLFTQQRPPGAPRWGKAHKDFQRQWYRRSMSVKGPVQEMPVFESRVELDPEVTDFWGIPVARISGHRHPHDIEISRFMASKAEAWLKEAGAIETWIRVPGGFNPVLTIMAVAYWASDFIKREWKGTQFRSN